MNLLTSESVLMFVIAVAILTTVLIGLSIPVMRIYWFLQERKNKRIVK